MIQDIGDHTYHVEYRPVPLARDGILLSYRGREVLVKLTGEKSFTYPTYGDYDAWRPIGSVGSLPKIVSSFIWLTKPCRKKTDFLRQY